MELKRVIEAIAIQSGLLSELLQVLERETNEMGAVNINAMSLSNLTKEELTARISAHTPLFQQAVSALTAREGLPASTSLGKLAEHIAKKGGRELRIQQQQLLGLAERVRRATSLNREIAERFTSMVADSLSLMTRLINQSNVYGASGGYLQRSATAVMINREA
ncbi:MAG TPA: flagellar protein FlgN [Desulfuromonadales bacterium]|nr:flagellar protein FlgN [Desulfuromonadales bacterium]